MDKEFEYDVYLSHSRHDKPQVRTLAKRLKNMGLRVWFDEWEIMPGDDVYIAIENGLEESRNLVFCMTSSAFGSEWIELERSTFIFRDPVNKDRRFIPLLLENCSIRSSMRRYAYIDGRQLDDETIDKLFRACQGKIDPDTGNKDYADWESFLTILRQAHLPRIRSSRALFGPSYEKTKRLTEVGAAIKEIYHYGQNTNIRINLIYMDIDRFSKINTKYGVGVGNEVLLTIENIIESVFYDHFSARWIGDQFITFMFDMTMDRTIKLANRLGERIQNYAWSSITPGLYVTASQGVASFKRNEESDDWIMRAQEGLRDAKKAAGNRVEKGPSKKTEEMVNRDPSFFMS